MSEVHFQNRNSLTNKLKSNISTYVFMTAPRKLAPKVFEDGDPLVDSYDDLIKKHNWPTQSSKEMPVEA